MDRWKRSGGRGFQDQVEGQREKGDKQGGISIFFHSESLYNCVVKITHSDLDDTERVVTVKLCSVALSRLLCESELSRLLRNVSQHPTASPPDTLSPQHDQLLP